MEGCGCWCGYVEGGGQYTMSGGDFGEGGCGGRVRVRCVCVCGGGVGGSTRCQEDTSETEREKERGFGRRWRGEFNPFSAPACEVFGQKEPRTRLKNNTFRPGPITYLFQCYPFFTCQCEKEDKKA